MHKKILAICAALVAFAALPAMASASPVLQNSGVTVATGSGIKATNVTNTVMTTSLGNIVCSTSTMAGTLVTNSGTLIEGNIESASFSGTGASGKCTGPFGDVAVTVPSLPWCIKTTKTADQFELRGGKCSEGSREVTFILDASFGECKYSRASVLGTLTTGGTQAHLTASGVEFAAEAGNPFGCPSNGKLDMTYKLETTGGAALQIN
jgi:hypothetical protein